jgi:hypothetical protein
MLYFHHTAGDDLAVTVTAEHVSQKRQCRGVQDEGAASNYRPANKGPLRLYSRVKRGRAAASETLIRVAIRVVWIVIATRC